MLFANTPKQVFLSNPPAFSTHNRCFQLYESLRYLGILLDTIRISLYRSCEPSPVITLDSSLFVLQTVQSSLYLVVLRHGSREHTYRPSQEPSRLRRRNCAYSTRIVKHGVCMPDYIGVVSLFSRNHHFFGFPQVIPPNNSFVFTTARSLLCLFYARTHYRDVWFLAFACPRGQT